MRALRRFYWRWIRRYPCEICHVCGRPVGQVWSAPEALWRRVADEALGTDRPADAGIMCIPCFDATAHELRIFLRWESDWL